MLDTKALNPKLLLSEAVYSKASHEKSIARDSRVRMLTSTAVLVDEKLGTEIISTCMCTFENVDAFVYVSVYALWKMSKYMDRRNGYMCMCMYMYACKMYMYERI